MTLSVSPGIKRAVPVSVGCALLVTKVTTVGTFGAVVSTINSPLVWSGLTLPRGSVR